MAHLRETSNPCKSQNTNRTQKCYRTFSSWFFFSIRPYKEQYISRDTLYIIRPYYVMNCRSKQYRQQPSLTHTHTHTHARARASFKFQIFKEIYGTFRLLNIMNHTIITTIQFSLLSQCKILTFSQSKSFYSHNVKSFYSHNVKSFFFFFFVVLPFFVVIGF